MNCDFQATFGPGSGHCRLMCGKQKMGKPSILENPGHLGKSGDPQNREKGNMLIIR